MHSGAVIGGQMKMGSALANANAAALISVTARTIFW
jgi:hypothetical protein